MKKWFVALALCLCVALPVVAGAVGDLAVPSATSDSVIEGANQTVTYGDAARFRTTQEFLDLVRVEVDYRGIKRFEDYNASASKDSTVIELTADYVKTLSVGKHKLHIVAGDSKVETSFMVKAAANVPTEPAPDTSELPQTGDNSHLALYAALMIVSAAALTAMKRQRA